MSSLLRWSVLGGAGLLATVAPATAFSTDGAWPTGTIVLTLQMTSAGNPPADPSGGFTDGSINWNEAISPAVSVWNSHLVRCQLVANVNTSTDVGQNNGANNLFFSNDIYGEAFGSRTLAVTVTDRRGIRGLRYVEADVVFNTNWTWNSYRGNLNSNSTDIRRVALHEIGHILGLNHPDQDMPVQNVAAIMNSTVGNIESPTADDIAGTTALYGSPTPVPTITRQPQNQSVTVGSTAAAMTVELNGTVPPPTSEVLAYSWFFTPTGRAQEFLFTFPDGSIPLGAAQLEDAGSYYVVVETPDGEVASSPATLTVSPTTTTPATRLANISTRGYAGTGEESLIVGFVVGGTVNRRVLIRAVGPTLGNAPFDVPDALHDPSLELHSSTAVIATNDNWGDDNPSELSAAFTQTGAFMLPADSLDAALIFDAPPGLYTAIAKPNAGGGRLALVEIYDLGDNSDPTSRLLNLSTRGRVGTDAEILIAGFVVKGPGPRTYLLRAAGDSLEKFGITGFLDDPLIVLYSGQTQLRWTDDWDSPGFLQPILTDTFTATGAFAFVDRQESALRVTLNPGLYTLHVRGFNDLTGVAIVEVYEVR